MTHGVPLKLEDCAVHGPGSGAELFVVEGDSAADAVLAVRDRRTQAVLPMMGKPLNATKASLQKVETYPLFVALADAIGAGHGAEFDMARVRYERVVLLMDADADGIHCGALMCLYLHRMMRDLLEDGRVSIAHAPMATIVSVGHGRIAHVFTDAEYRATATSWRSDGVDDLTAVRYRGLASLDHRTLAATCLRPSTRTLHALGPGDAAAALSLFGGDQTEPGHPRLF